MGRSSPALDIVPQAPQSAHSMSRRGNDHDNAAVASFVYLLKRERIRRRVCRSCHGTRQDVLDYIEVFCQVGMRRRTVSSCCVAMRDRNMDIPVNDWRSRLDGRLPNWRRILVSKASKAALKPEKTFEPVRIAFAPESVISVVFADIGRGCFGA